MAVQKNREWKGRSRGVSASAPGLPYPHSAPQPALLPAESLKDLVASCSRGAKAEAPMEVVKAEVMEMLTPPPSDVGSPSHSSPLSLSGGSSNSSSDSEPDSPLCDHDKVWGLWEGSPCPEWGGGSAASPQRCQEQNTPDASMGKGTESPGLAP